MLSFAHTSVYDVYVPPYTLNCAVVGNEENENGEENENEQEEKNENGDDDMAANETLQCYT